ECRPLFIGILGERYGWVPENFNEDALSKYGWVQHQTGKSVTELEILYGVLDHRYLRNHYEQIDAHQRLGAYFHGLLNPVVEKPWTGESVRGLSELPYHQTCAENWSELESTLCELRFVAAKCAPGMSAELVVDYQQASNALPETKTQREQDRQQRDAMRAYGDALIAYASDGGNSLALPVPPDTTPGE
ncbi:MAG: hypothetical protein KDA51_16085, partial [Planctomycetales bacterium]|nr:hypothetical protein [Planctomycetales bacterium]